MWERERAHLMARGCTVQHRHDGALLKLENRENSHHTSWINGLDWTVKLSFFISGFIQLCHITLQHIPYNNVISCYEHWLCHSVFNSFMFPLMIQSKTIFDSDTKKIQNYWYTLQVKRSETTSWLRLDQPSLYITLYLCTAMSHIENTDICQHTT